VQIDPDPTAASMTPTPSDPQLLEADPGRQAADIIRGYVYQVWWSVHAWLLLGDHQVLVLEGAEDFDLLSRDQATTTQVKNLTANLTLRSKPAVEAIGNFWDLKQRTRTPLRFCFLTSSRAGIEQGQHFGPGVSGMRAWNNAGRGGDGVAALRKFLLTLDLPASLQDFLRTASPERVREELLAPFEWQLDQGEIEDVERMVRRLLIIYGEKNGVPADEAGGVADRMFAEACKVASRGAGRSLHRADFLTIWGEETRGMSLREFRLAALELGSLLPGTSGPPITSFPRQVRSDPPPLPFRCASRTRLVANLRETLSKTGQLILVGTVCMGKTTLARLVAGPGSLWVDLADDHGSRGLLALQALARRLDAGPPPDAVVIDCAVDPSEGDIVHGLALGESLRRLQRAAIPFIVAAPHPLPSKTAALLDLPAASVMAVPGFADEEIVELLAAHGCPPGIQGALAQVMALRTERHPQLIAAWCSDLAATNWRTSPLENLPPAPAAAAQVLLEARRLVSTLPAGTRVLVDRLSLLVHPFRRSHALAVGNLRPAVPRPGEAFDRLDGTWIGRLAGDYYGMSPLLCNAAAEVLAPAVVAALHRSLAKILLRTKPLTPVEAAAGFFHAYRGEDARTVVQLAVDLLRSRSDVQRAVFPALRWFAFVGSAAELPPFLTGSNTPVLRMLQYRVAPGSEDKQRIAALWDQEVRGLAGSPVHVLIARLQFSAALLMDSEVRHGSSELFAWLLEAIEAAKSLRSLDPASAAGLLTLDPGSGEGPVDLTTALFMFLLTRCSTISDLAAVIDNLERLDETLRTRLLQALDLYPGFAQRLLDRSCRSCRHRPETMGYCLEVLNRLAAAGAVWRREDLRQAALGALASIVAETDPEAALDLLRRGRRPGARSGLLDQAEASLLQQGGDHAAAWSIWRTSLPHWAADRDFDEVALAFATGEAATSAARLGHWDEAAALFSDASRLLRDQHGEGDLASAPSLLPLRLDVEHAYALARGSRWRECVAAFDRVLAELSALAAAQADRDEFRITCKLLGHMLVWLHNPDLLHELLPGTVSWLKVTREILSLATTSVEHLWSLLCQLESTVAGASEVLDRMRSGLAASSDRQVRLFLYTSEVAHCLRTGRVETVVPHLAALSDVVTVFGSRISYVLNELLYSLLAWLNFNPGAEPPWDRWRADLLTIAPADAAQIDQWLDLARGVQHAPFVQVRRLMADPDSPDLSRLLAIARIATTPLDSPDLLFQAHFHLVFHRPRSAVLRHEGDVIAAIVQSRWLQLLERTPLLDLRLAAAAIRQACQHARPGLSKAAAILLAVSPGLSTHLDHGIRQALEELRDPAIPQP
jgi:hypothetical protein